MNEREGNWLPEPYNDIVRRTPVINSGAPTPVPAQCKNYLILFEFSVFNVL